MNRIPPFLAALLVATVLSGCMGYPPDAVRRGSDPAFIVSSGDAECFVGPPFSDVPPSLRRAAEGRRIGESFPADTQGLDCNEVLVLTGVLGQFPRLLSLPRAQFEELANTAPVVGEQVTLPSRDGSYQAHVVTENATTVQVEPVLGPPRYDPRAGVDIVSEFQGDQIVVWARANSTGQIVAGPIPAIGLPAGNYTILESRGRDLVFAADRSADAPAGTATARVVRVQWEEREPVSGFGFRGAEPPGT